MDVFARFPSELQLHTLCFVPAHDLDRLFQLQGPFPGPKRANSAFLQLQHQALLAKYHRQHVVLSNDPAQGTFPLAFLDYLVAHGVHINPSDITLAVVDFSNYHESLPFLHGFFEQHAPVLHRFCSSVRIRLVLFQNVSLDNGALKTLFMPLHLTWLKISSFTIKYQPRGASETCMEPEAAAAVSGASGSATSPPPSSDITCDSLSLHLFRPTHLMRHLCDESRCFNSGSLRHLDLSFNSLTEYDLMGVAFPPGLEVLNLSNNNLRVLCNESMPVERMPKLRVLDICNNNLMRFEFAEGSAPSSVHVLRLSGNLFTCYASIFHTRHFHGLREIDLSRNLLDHFSKFPDALRKINICSNYFRLDPEELVGIFPSGLVHLAISNPVPADFWDGFGSALVEKAGLWDLRFLDVCNASCV